MICTFQGKAYSTVASRIFKTTNRFELLTTNLGLQSELSTFKFQIQIIISFTTDVSTYFRRASALLPMVRICLEQSDDGAG